MPSNQPDAALIRYATILFAITLAFVWFVVWTGNAPFGPSSWLGSDSYLVVERMRLAQDGIADFHPLTTHYFGQFGLQGVVLGALSASSLLSVPELAVPAALAFSALSAVTCALLVPILLPRIGVIGVVAVWLTFAASPWMRSFSFSLYWVLPALLAPLVLMAHLGPRLSRGWRAGLLPLGFLFLAFLLKCLCGNEYITTVTLLACAGYALSGWRSPTRISGYALIFLTCVAAFSAGIALQILQLHLVVDGVSGNEILWRALLHTGTDGGVYQTFLDPLLFHLEGDPANAALVTEIRQEKSDWLIFRTAFLLYLGFPALDISLLRLDIWIFCGLAFVALARVALSAIFARSLQTLLQPRHAAGLAAALALAGAISWQVLAWRHMAVHFHLNAIIFAIGLVPLSVVWICDTIVDLNAKRNGGTSPRFRDPIPFLLGATFFLALAVLWLGSWNFVENIRVQPSTIAAGRTDGTLNGRIERISREAGPARDELTRGMGQLYDWVTVEGWAFGTRGPVVIEIVESGTVRATFTPTFSHPLLIGTEAAEHLTGFAARFPLLPSADEKTFEFYARYADGGRFRTRIEAPTTAAAPSR